MSHIIIDPQLSKQVYPAHSWNIKRHNHKPHTDSHSINTGNDQIAILQLHSNDYIYTKVDIASKQKTIHIHYTANMSITYKQ